MAEFDPGRFKDRVTILQPGRVQESKYGSNTVTWSELTTVWAEVRDMPPSRERIAEGLEISRRPCRVRMRYRTDVRSDMRFSFLGRMLRIVAGPAELGRREVIEFTAEELSTEGNQP